MINMLKADILSLYIPGALEEMAEFVVDLNPSTYVGWCNHNGDFDRNDFAFPQY